MTPHFIRSLSARELSPPSGRGRARAMLVLGGESGGESISAHLPTLAKRVEELPRHIETVVLIDDPSPDMALRSLIDDMVSGFASSDIDVLSRAIAVPEAVKRVEGGTVREGVDRSRLVAVRPPEVIRRETLANALSEPATNQWMNPTEFVVSRGGRLALYEAPSGSWSILSMEARMELWATEASLRLGGLLGPGDPEDAPATG